MVEIEPESVHHHLGGRVEEREVRGHHDPRRLGAVGVGRGQIGVQPRELRSLQVVQVKPHGVDQPHVRGGVPASHKERPLHVVSFAGGCPVDIIPPSSFTETRTARLAARVDRVRAGQS